MHNKDKTLFFAYESKHKHNDENINAIKRAQKHYNENPNRYCEIKLWEDFKETGTLINRLVIEKINESDFFASDITSLNHNVLFELGYAFGKKKIAHIFFNTSITKAKENFSKSILNVIKYQDFAKHRDITNYFKDNITKHIKIFNEKNIQDEPKYDYVYINSAITIQSSNELTESLKILDYFKPMIIDRTEIGYQTLDYYIQHILDSKALIIHMVPSDMENSFIENANSSFLAGLAYGLEKKLAIISGEKNKAPLDYRDLVIDYFNDDDCVDKATKWIESNFNIYKEASTTKKIEKKIIEPEKNVSNNEKQNFNILKLGVYYPLAEDEKDLLPNYFVSTNTYAKAISNNSSLIIFGRKGSGKSAIYYNLLNDLKLDNKNLVIQIYPDTEDIANDILFVESYSKESSRKSFFILMWKYIVYSKLALLIYEKDSSKNKYDYSYIENNSDIMKHSFSQLLHYFNDKYSIKNEDGTTPPLDTTLLQIIQQHHIIPLTNLLKTYITTNKYCKLYILADNLDKFWKPECNLLLQADMISALLHLKGKLLNELCLDEQKHFLSITIFLRKDIFEYILKESPEKDKTIIHSTEINWEEYPEKLSNIIEERLKYALEKDENQTFEASEILEKYFKLVKNKNKIHPMDAVKEYVFPRPRDYIFFFGKMFESAANRNRQEIKNVDFDYAKLHYFKYFKGNLITELSTDFKQVDKIIEHIARYDDKEIKYKNLKKYLKNKKYSQKEIDALLKKLHDFEFIYICKKSSKKHVNIDEFIENKDIKLLFFYRHRYRINIKK